MSKILITKAQRDKLYQTSPYDTLIKGNNPYYINQLDLDQYLKTEGDNNPYDVFQAIAYEAGVLDLDLSDLESDTSISPYIKSLVGVLEPNVKKQIEINGLYFDKNTTVILEGTTATILSVAPNKIIIEATCRDAGAHEIQLFNGTKSSKTWSSNYIDCITLPTGAEQRLGSETTVSASTQFSNSYRPALVVDGNESTQHYSQQNQAQGHRIEINLENVITFITKIKIVNSGSYSSNPFTLEVDGQAIDIALTSGVEVNLESYGLVGKTQVALVYSNPTGVYANMRELYIYGKQ
jgi:hypothetical protein